MHTTAVGHFFLVFLYIGLPLNITTYYIYAGTQCSNITLRVYTCTPLCYSPLSLLSSSSDQCPPSSTPYALLPDSRHIILPPVHDTGERALPPSRRGGGPRFVRQPRRAVAMTNLMHATTMIRCICTAFLHRPKMVEVSRIDRTSASRGRFWAFSHRTLLRLRYVTAG